MHHIFKPPIACMLLSLPEQILQLSVITANKIGFKCKTAASLIVVGLPIKQSFSYAPMKPSFERLLCCMYCVYSITTL